IDGGGFTVVGTLIVIVHVEVGDTSGALVVMLHLDHTGELVNLPRVGPGPGILRADRHGTQQHYRQQTERTNRHGIRPQTRIGADKKWLIQRTRRSRYRV